MGLISKLINNEKNHLSERAFENQYYMNDLIFNRLFGKHPEAVFTLKLDGELQLYNKSLLNRFDIEKSKAGSQYKQYFHNETFKKYLKLVCAGKAQCFTQNFQHQNGQLYFVELTLVPLHDHDSKVLSIYGIAKDITRFVQQKNKMETIMNKFELAQKSGKIGSWDYDIQKDEIYWSNQLYELTGRDKDDQLTPCLEEGLQFIHPEDRARYRETMLKSIEAGRGYFIEYRILRKDQTIIYVSETVEIYFDEEKNPVRLIGNTQDISYKKLYEEKINKLAFYDSLTSLPNEILFTNRVKELINTNERFTVFYLDIDQFRNINHVIGRANGDQLLVQFSERIQMILPYSSMLARLSSDEFGIIITDYLDIENPEVMAKTIIDCFNKPFFVEDYEIYLNISIGISIYPPDGSSYENILNNASTALYRAKSLGHNHYQLYSSKSNITSFKQYELERDLRKSIDNSELILHFQPRVEAKTGKIVCAEALIRWQHPVWGLVSPGEFIPIAEESGFINNISDWVTEQVCMYLNKWKDEELNLVPISINITSNRFLRSDWKEVLLNSLKKHNVDPSLLEFEITETTLLQHEKVVESAFQYLKQLGIRIALDDFGTGYSSLSHIVDFSIDTLKLDKSFIQQIAHKENVEVMIKSIIFMANGLNMNIVAEGVETLEQLEFLKQQECSEIQGFLFSEPVPEKKFKCFIKRGIY